MVNIVPSLAVIGFFIYLAVFELITEGLDDIIGIIVIFTGVLSGGNRMIDFTKVDFRQNGYVYLCSLQRFGSTSGWSSTASIRIKR